MSQPTPKQGFLEKWLQKAESNTPKTMRIGWWVLLASSGLFLLLVLLPPELQSGIRNVFFIPEANYKPVEAQKDLAEKVQETIKLNLKPLDANLTEAQTEQYLTKLAAHIDKNKGNAMMYRSMIDFISDHCYAGINRNTLLMSKKLGDVLNSHAREGKLDTVESAMLDEAQKCIPVFETVPVPDAVVKNLMELRMLKHNANVERRQIVEKIKVYGANKIDPETGNLLALFKSAEVLEAENKAAAVRNEAKRRARSVRERTNSAMWRLYEENRGYFYRLIRENKDLANIFFHPTAQDTNQHVRIGKVAAETAKLYPDFVFSYEDDLQLQAYFPPPFVIEDKLYHLGKDKKLHPARLAANPVYVAEDTLIQPLFVLPNTPLFEDLGKYAPQNTIDVFDNAASDTAKP